MTLDHVRAAFEAATARDEGGATLAIVTRDGLLVDLVHGSADVDRPMTTDTPVLAFSCSKSVLAATAGVLVSRGVLELDTPVAVYWPEFAAAGKEDITVRAVLSHRAGLPRFERSVARAELRDWDRLCAELAASPPRWSPPAAGWAYHAVTWGWLVGEILQRASGQSLTELTQSLVFAPSGVDLSFVSPRPEEMADAERPALARVFPPRDHPASAPRPRWLTDEAISVFTLGGALGFPGPGVSDVSTFDDPWTLGTMLPALSLRGTAVDFARLHHQLVADGSPLLPASVLDDMSRPQSSGPPVLGAPFPNAFGSGFQLSVEGGTVMLSETSVGHGGVTGSLVFGDACHGLGFAFLTSQWATQDDQRARRIVQALRHDLR